MKINKQHLLSKAINNLAFYNKIIFNDKEIRLICLIREEDRRPFHATWWKGKELYLIAVDEIGCLFLRHSGGYILKIDPRSLSEEIIAKSEAQFIGMIE